MFSETILGKSYPVEGFTNFVKTYQLPIIGCSNVCRVLNVQLGETSRLAWLGVEVDPLAESDLWKAYNRPSENVNESSSSKWFIAKNSIVSGLGLLGIKQEQRESTTEGEAPTPKVRRKRVVRKKVAKSQV